MNKYTDSCCTRACSMSDCEVEPLIDFMEKRPSVKIVASCNSQQQLDQLFGRYDSIRLTFLGSFRQNVVYHFLDLSIDSSRIYTTNISLPYEKLRSLVITNAGLKSIYFDTALLEHLNLTNNALQYLPYLDEHMEWPNLRYLNLSKNLLNSEFILPAMPKLEKLILSDNNLGTWQLPYLCEHIELSNCKLRSSVLKRCNFNAQRLKHLDLTKNILCSFSLPEDAEYLKYLEYLDISDSNITRLSLGFMPNLKYFSIVRNHIKTIDLRAPNLLEFYASNNLLDDSWIFPLMPYLKYADLSGNPLGPRFALPCTYLSANPPIYKISNEL